MNDKRRIYSLDSLRGIAAFSVLLYHCYLVSFLVKSSINNALETLSFPARTILSLSINLFTSGHSAVILFFVLSGFVLTISIVTRKQSYKTFILKRIFRIYPILFISIIMSYLLHLLIGHNPIPNYVQPQWYQYYVAGPIQITISDLLGHVALTGIRPGHSFLNSPIWSLVHEMRISLIFPLLVLLLSMDKKLAMFIVLGFFLSIAGEMVSNFLIMAKYVQTVYIVILETPLYSMLQTLYYLVFFLMGIALALKREKIHFLINRMPEAAKFISVIIAVIFLIYFDSVTTSFVDYLRGIGAVMLIAFAYSWERFKTGLSMPLFAWLGKISYSLYIFHWLVIYTVFELWGNSLPLWQCVAITIISSLILAELMSRFIEYPFINLGKRILGK